MEIITSPAGPGRFRACLDGRVLCASTTTPLFSAARVLEREGVAPSTPLTQRHEGSTITSMRSTVGAAAAWTVTECDRKGLRMVRYRAMPQDMGRAGVRVAVGTAESGPGLWR